MSAGCIKDHSGKPAAHRVVVLVEIPPDSDPGAASLDKIGVRDALRALLLIALARYQIDVLAAPAGGVEAFCQLQAAHLGGSALLNLRIHPVAHFAEVVGQNAVLIVLGGGEAALAVHDEATRRIEPAVSRSVIVVPVASTGGAALVLWRRGYGTKAARGSFAAALRDDLVYDAVFRDVLRETLCGFDAPS